MVSKLLDGSEGYGELCEMVAEILRVTVGERSKTGRRYLVKQDVITRDLTKPTSI